MGKHKISPAEIILLLTAILAAAGLLFLPQEIWIPGQWAKGLYVSKYYALTVSYICTLCGLWIRWKLPDRFVTASSGQRLAASAAGTVLACSGAGAMLLFLTGNPLSLHMEGLGIGFLILWPVLHGGGQLLLCLYVRPLTVKLIPVGLVLAEGLFTLWVYYDPLHQSSGWDALGALIVGVFVLWAAGAVLLAWILYGILLYVRRRKAARKSDADPQM